MLNQKKRRKIQLPDPKTKLQEDSTRNSDRVPSSQRLSEFAPNHRKSFTKLINKRTFDKEPSEKHSSHSKHNHSSGADHVNNPLNESKTSSNQFLDLKTPNELNTNKKNECYQKYNYASNTQSTCSLYQNAEQGPNKDKRKFKLYCQVKKQKQTQKKSQYEKQTERFAVSSTTSESWIKNSVFSRNSQKNDSTSTHKSKSKSIKHKINLNEKIKLIKSKQKQKQTLGQKQTSSLNTLAFQQTTPHQASRNEENSKKAKTSLSKKHSTLNVKSFLVLTKFSSDQQKLSVQALDNKKKLSEKTDNQTNEVETPKEKLTKKKSSQFLVENKILPQDSQIIEESVKKLSQIRQQKHEDTVSRQIKTIIRNSVDQSKSKDVDQTSLHLSVNSICRDPNKFFGCILQTTELRQSSGLKKEIESSLSELEKSRQKIDIKKFQGLKNIAQLGSSISEVQCNMTTVEKIEFHIELINTLSNFVYKSTELEYLMEDWDQLNFLIYKKFYLERMKILNFLKKYPIKNPFCIKRGSIETKDILKALRQNQADIKRIKNTLDAENVVIKKNLEVFYNQFSKEQHGEKINLLEYDNFSHWIYKELWDEIQLFSYSRSHSQRELEDRILKSLQAGFLISELNGNYVTPFEDAEIASRQNKHKIYIEDNLKVFERYVLNKKK